MERNRHAEVPAARQQCTGCQAARALGRASEVGRGGPGDGGPLWAGGTGVCPVDFSSCSSVRKGLDRESQKGEDVRHENPLAVSPHCSEDCSAIFCWASASAPFSAFTWLPSASPITFCTARVTVDSTFSVAECG